VWIRDDIGHGFCASEEVLAIKNVSSLHVVFVVLQYPHNGTVTTSWFKDQSCESFSPKQGFRGVRRCRVRVQMTA